MEIVRPTHYPRDSVTLSPSTVAVVIVTYDSGRVLGMCLDSLRAQTRCPDLVVIVDNNSPEGAYLDEIPRSAPFKLVRGTRNEGFCGGNNTGYALARSCKYVLFLNPDAFLSERFIETALLWMQQPENARVGCLTGTLLGFDLERRRPTGRIDSTGVFQTWYGKWRDRGQGSEWTGASASQPEDLPAVCGALMFCRTEALEQVTLRGNEVFDSRFFMYKEDIDLSLRLRARGWRLTYQPELICHHGRGWRGRTAVSYQAKYLSARNELRVSLRNRLRGLPYTLLKLVYVVALERPLVGLTRRLRERRRGYS
jgi:N-acetylglucosaminyl-diphospho-decaprenol L-rhamnosyltransferase